MEAMGVQDVSDLDASQEGVILRAINKATQTFSVMAPAAWWGRDELGEIVLGPETVDITITTAKGRAYTSTGITTAKRGLALIISGDEGIVNRTVQKGSTGELLFPYPGSSGLKEATLYHDAIEMPSAFRRLCSPVTILNGDELKIEGSTSGLLGQTFGSKAKLPGRPTKARLVPRMNQGGFITTFMAFDALPSSEFRLFGEYLRKPAEVTDLEDERNDLVPPGYLDSILVPFVLSAAASMSDSVVVNAAKLATALQEAAVILSEAVDAEGDQAPVQMSNAYYD